MTYQKTLEVLLGVATVAAVVILPLSAHAGLFSALFDTAEAEGNLDLGYTSDDSAQMVPLLKAVLHVDPNPAKGGGDLIIEEGALVPHRDIDKDDASVNSKTANGEISVYVVREGDTLSEIAEMFDVSAKTILWANNITNASKIRPNDELVILPITGVRHVVKSGDTIASIAKKYSGDVDDILAYNQLVAGEELKVGDTVVIPDGTMATPEPAKKAAPKRTSGNALTSGGSSSGFVHPLPGSTRTQGIHGYNGVDLAAAAGTPIRAAAGGQVIVARGSGWNGGYGLYVVVKHANGAQTLYAHCSSLTVAVGDQVEAGETIGYVGNTGRSTGNHLHFEVRGAKNPF